MREEQPTRRRLFQLGLLLVIAATGCGWTAPRPGSDDQLHAHEHDPDEVPSMEADVAMPANYAEAVKRVREYATTIKHERPDGASSDVYVRAPALLWMFEESGH
jgi:hypothetical protein